MSLAALALLRAAPALAQARNPFNVGIQEGGGAPGGLLGWVMAQQIVFERMMSGAVRAATNPGGLWLLIGISFAYGALHAAGPGHGKAVVASYMVANERALKRGLVIAGLAALLQGFVAIAIISVMALALNTSAARMRDAASLVEAASFAGIAALGFWLVWRKGAAFLAAWRLCGAALPALGVASAFACEPAGVGGASLQDASCGHLHMPDPRMLDGRFSLREAATTVLVAGARPCSGAILVLVFARAQNVFGAGIAATFAMSIGTALATGALAATAVFAKRAALRLTRADSPRAALLARGLELAAACLVLALGLALSAGFALPALLA